MVTFLFRNILINLSIAFVENVCYNTPHEEKIMDKNEMFDELNSLKTELNIVEQNNKKINSIRKFKQRELKNYITLTGITKEFIPLDAVALGLSVATITCGDIKFGAAIAGLSLANFVSKFFILKHQKKRVETTKDEIALTYYVDSVNENIRHDLKKKIDEYTEVLYPDEEPAR